jgi:hypothetical protein
MGPNRRGLKSGKAGSIGSGSESGFQMSTALPNSSSAETDQSTALPNSSSAETESVSSFNGAGAYNNRVW